MAQNAPTLKLTNTVVNVVRTLSYLITEKIALFIAAVDVLRWLVVCKLRQIAKNAELNLRILLVEQTKRNIALQSVITKRKTKKALLNINALIAEVCLKMPRLINANTVQRLA